MKILNFSLFLFLLSLLRSFQGYTQLIELTIYDKETYESIPFVKVTNSQEVLLSNEKGMVSIPKATFFTFRHFDYYSLTLSIEELEKCKYRVGMSPNSNSMDEIVLSASKFEEKKKDVAQKIQVIRNNEIKNMNQTSTADVLGNSGNIFVQKSQLGGGSPIIRGFETNKVLIMVDGVRMNNAIYRGGHLQNVITLDNAIMERVEVLYGPGSVVYGSDAIGGVMSFITRMPKLSKSTKANVNSNGYLRFFSAASGYSGNASISIGKNKIASLTSISYSKFGDLRQGSKRSAFAGNFGSRPWYVDRINGEDTIIQNLDTNLQIGSGYSQYDFLQKLLYKPNKSVEHIFNFQLSNSSKIDRYDRLTQQVQGLPKFAEWYYGPQFRLLSSYNINLLEPRLIYDRVRFTFAYQKIGESRMTRKFNQDILTHRVEDLDILTLNTDLFKKIGSHELRYGIDLFYNNVNSTAYAENIVEDTLGSIDTRYPDGGSQMFSMALFLTHTLELNKKIILNNGIRLNYVGLKSKFINKTFFPFPFDDINQKNTALNGNIGIIYLPNDPLRVSVNLSTGFRAPNVDDASKVFESIPGKVVVPNPELKSEYSYTGDIGFVYKLSKDVSISANGYFTLLTNALTLQPGLFNGLDSVLYDGEYSQVLTTTNTNNAYVTGIESILSGKLNEQFNIFGTFNYTYGRIINTEFLLDFKDSLTPLDHIPPVFGKFGLNYQKEKIRVEVFIQYCGWKFIEDYGLSGEDNEAFALPQGMPGWYTINSRLNYLFNSKFSMQLACENILDKNYRKFASNISAPGRNFIFTLRANL